MANQESTNNTADPGTGGTAGGPPSGAAPGDRLLQSLVRPGFFSGQLLTDRDLTALTNWSRRRFGLARLRHGWGIASGLEITAKPGAEGRVTLHPGYAIDRRGHDIVAQYAVDLDPRSLAAGDAAAGGEAAQGGGAGANGQPAPGPDGPAQLVVDLWIEYKEQATDPKPALARRACSEASESAFARIDETYVIRATAVDGAVDAAGAATVGSADAAADWQDGFDKCLDVARNYEARFASSGPAPSGADAMDWLNAWIAGHPLAVFPEISAEIAALADLGTAAPAAVARILFYMVTDCRIAYLAQAWDGDDGSGRIGLGRVHLSRRDGDRAPRYVVDRIDALPPRRRPLADDAWPAPAGSVNLAPLVWRELDEADSWLNARGMKAAWCEPFDLAAVATPAALVGLLDFTPFVSVWSRPVVRYLADPRFGNRLVAVEGRARTEIRQARIRRSSETDPVMPGGEVQLSYHVTNTGRTPLDLAVADGLLPGDVAVEEIKALTPDTSRSIDVGFRIPEDPAAALPELCSLDDDGNLVLTSSVELIDMGDGGGEVLDRIEPARLTVLQPLGLTVSLKPDPDRGIAVLRQPVRYRITVSNTGKVALDVRLQVGVSGGSSAELPPFRLAAGEQRSESHEAGAVDHGSDRFEVFVEAAGTAAHHRQASGTARHVLPVERDYQGLWQILGLLLRSLLGLAPRHVKVIT